MHPTTDIDAAARYALARELCPGLDVLDLGAGRGWGSALLAEWGARSVTAVDIEAFPDVSGVSRARADACSVEAMEPLGTFGLVLALGMVEHVESPVALMASVARLMAPGGIAIVTCPADEDGPAASARAFAQLAAGTLGKPTQILFTLPAEALLIVDPERAASPESESAAGRGEIHSTLRLGDLRPFLRNAAMIVGVWGAQIPESCVVAATPERGIEPAVMPAPIPVSPEPTAGPAPGFWARTFGRRGR